jgi:hypothetical protein
MIARYQATARSHLLRTILLRSEVALEDRYSKGLKELFLCMFWVFWTHENSV